MCISDRLNNLCARGLGIISWTIIFMPFMLMSLVTAILLYVFGLDPTTGKLKYYTPDGAETIGVDARGAVNVDSNKNTSEYARPIDLIKYRQHYPETSHDDNNFNPQSSKTQTNTVNAMGPIKLFFADVNMLCTLSLTNSMHISTKF